MILVLSADHSLNPWSRSGAVYRVGLRLLWKPKVVSSILAAIVFICFVLLLITFFVELLWKSKVATQMLSPIIFFTSHL